MGTPALPIAAIVAMNTHITISVQVKTTPLMVPIKRTVMRINAAQAFILMVEHSGRVNFATRGDIPKLCCAFWSVIGSVAQDEREKKATVRACDMPRNALIGEMPLNMRRIGRTINPWMRLAAIIVITYNPRLWRLFQLWPCIL